MSKSYEELATEMTVAWLNAVGQSVVAGKLNSSWLNSDALKDIYKASYASINEAINGND